jgi:outer membrane protein TolC
MTGGKAANTDFVQWWSAFSDPVLLDLIQEAAKNNQDLLLATGRIEEARALAVGAKSNRYPSVDATLSGSKVRTSETAGKLAAGAEPVSKDFQLGLTASYEVDFWGNCLVQMRPRKQDYSHRSTTVRRYKPVCSVILHKVISPCVPLTHNWR